MEPDPFLRLMTFNVQAMFRPDEAPLDWNEGPEVIRRATDIADGLLQLPEGERPDVICLQEIFYKGAFETLYTRLVESGDWPHWAWSTEIDGKRLVAGAAGGAGLGFLLGGDPLVVTGLGALGGILGGPAYSNLGGNSGLMILSRQDFPFQKISHDYSGSQPGNAELIDVDDYTLLSGRYNATAGSDSLASKGFLMVRIATPRFGTINVLTTHMQASEDDDCPDDRHYGGPDCNLHADIRREQVDQIMRSLGYAMRWDEVGRTIITGDMNIRGEQDRRSFIDERGTTVSEWDSVFGTVVYETGRGQNFTTDFQDAWHVHTRLPDDVVPGAGMIDDGITNVNFSTERAQRLDYILVPRNPDFSIEPHLMRIRFGTSDHRSLEAHFGLAARFDAPTRSDVLARHGFVAGPRGPTAYILRDPGQALPNVPPELARGGTGRLDWTLADIRPIDACLRDVEAGSQAIDAKAHCLRLGRVPGTYAVTAYVGRRNEEQMNAVPVDVLACDMLSVPFDPARELEVGAGGIDVPEEGIGARSVSLKVSEGKAAVHALSRPVFLRTEVPAGHDYLLKVERFTGDTCETALVAPVWRAEETAWPDPMAPNGVPSDVKVCWYQLVMRPHEAQMPYGCRVIIRNPARHTFRASLRQGACPEPSPRLEGDVAVEAKTDEAEFALEWTSSGKGESCWLVLEWDDPGMDMSGVRVTFKPQLTVFADKAAIKSILCKCLDETGWDATGSDEILIRITADDASSWSREISWKDVDTEKYLPGPAGGDFSSLIHSPVVFASTLRIDIVEIGDAGGRDRGHVVIDALAEEEDDLPVSRDIEVGSGRYRITGTLTRLEPPLR